MKRITFFNEKGGTGKTLFNMSFASWLAYDQGERVFVRDFDTPSNQIHTLRIKELEMAREDPAFARLITAAPYPIRKEEVTVDIRDAAAKHALAEKIRRESVGEGYYIMDFPGLFNSRTAFFNLAASGLIDTVIFPVDSDEASYARAMYVNSIINNPKLLRVTGRDHQDVLFLWNRETNQERRGKKDHYSEAEAMFRRIGIPVCNHRVREFLSFRRDGETFGFVKSTICYPRLNIRRNAPWLEDVFAELKARIDGTWTDPAPEEE